MSCPTQLQDVLTHPAVQPVCTLPAFPVADPTQTPEFRQWFGSSQVTQPDGSPMVLWRGESGGELYSVFDGSKTNQRGLFFFATEKAHADSYARFSKPRSFYLSAQHVLDLRSIDYTDKDTMRFLKEFAADFAYTEDRQTGEPVDIVECIESGTLYDLEGNGSGRAWTQLFNAAKYAGYDGVIVNDVTDGLCAPVAVVFAPTQIKSTENVGSFDPADPCIYR